MCANPCAVRKVCAPFWGYAFKSLPPSSWFFVCHTYSIDRTTKKAKKKTPNQQTLHIFSWCRQGIVETQSFLFCWGFFFPLFIFRYRASYCFNSFFEGKKPQQTKPPKKQFYLISSSTFLALVPPPPDSTNIEIQL